jgi:hypothetical protein
LPKVLLFLRHISPQGVAVSFLLCFTNSEVLLLLRTRLGRFLDRHSIQPGFLEGFHRLGLTIGNSRSDPVPESV